MAKEVGMVQKLFFVGWALPTTTLRTMVGGAHPTGIEPCQEVAKKKAKEFDVVIERDAEGNLIASVPGLVGCHTQARSLDELMERIKEAIALCLEVQGTEVDSLEFVGIQRLRVA